jgi:hypothetical protein
MPLTNTTKAVSDIVRVSDPTRRHELEPNELQIKVPRFQRRPVWKAEQKRTLIDSIRKDFPIGSLLLHQAAGNSEALLVDGLQRVTTLIEFDGSVLAFLKYNALPSEIRMDFESELLTHNTSLDVTRLATAAEEWFTTMGSPDRNEFDFDGLLQALAASDIIAIASPVSTGLQSASRAVIAYCRAWPDRIRNYQVPIVIYSGPEDDLDEVFERLNTQGTMLTKYDRLAARWDTQTTSVQNVRIRNEIEDKYEEIEDAGVELTDAPVDEHGDRVYNLYEYLMGLGRLLANLHPELFPQTSAEQDGFNVATVAHQLRTSSIEMALLPGKMTSAGGAIDPRRFEEALLEAVGVVASALSFLKVKVSSTLDPSPSYDLAHKRLQMISIVCDVLVTAWDPSTWQRRQGWGAQSPALRMTKLAIAQHYLYDLLSSESWSGAGDTEAYRRVWLIDEEDGHIVGSRNYYETPVDLAAFRAALSAWATRNVGRLTKQRSAPTPLDKVVLRLVYKDSISAAEQVNPDVFFDVDHVFPVKRLAGRIQVTDSDGWPIGAISNLILFPYTGNRQRGEKSLPEWIESAPDSAEKGRRQAEATRWLLDARFVDAAAIPVDDDNQDTLTLEEYGSFLERRWPTISERIEAGISIST